MSDEIPSVPDEIPSAQTSLVPPSYRTPTVRPVQKKQGRGGTILLGVAALVAVAGVAFAAGRFTAPAAAATNGTGRNGNPFASFNPGGFPGGGQFPGGQGGQFRGLGRSLTVRGQVTAASATSITVKLEDGSEVTLPVDAQTTYHKAVAGTSTDVAIGSTVVVEPGVTSLNPTASLTPGASFAPGGFGPVNFGPAVDVTVVQP